jgi:hypothetical protein
VTSRNFIRLVETLRDFDSWEKVIDFHTSRLKKISWDFERLHETLRNFMRLQEASLDFKRLKKTEKNFIRFLETSWDFTRLSGLNQTSWLKYSLFPPRLRVSWSSET